MAQLHRTMLSQLPNPELNNSTIPLVYSSLVVTKKISLSNSFKPLKFSVSICDLKTKLNYETGTKLDVNDLNMYEKIAPIKFKPLKETIASSSLTLVNFNVNDFKKEIFTEEENDLDSTIHEINVLPITCSLKSLWDNVILTPSSDSYSSSMSSKMLVNSNKTVKKQSSEETLVEDAEQRVSNAAKETNLDQKMKNLKARHKISSIPLAAKRLDEYLIKVETFPDVSLNSKRAINRSEICFKNKNLIGYSLSDFKATKSSRYHERISFVDPSLSQQESHRAIYKSTIKPQTENILKSCLKSATPAKKKRRVHFDASEEVKTSFLTYFRPMRSPQRLTKYVYGLTDSLEYKCATLSDENRKVVEQPLAQEKSLKSSLKQKYSLTQKKVLRFSSTDQVKLFKNSEPSTLKSQVFFRISKAPYKHSYGGILKRIDSNQSNEDQQSSQNTILKNKLTPNNQVEVMKNGAITPTKENLSTLDFY